VKGKGKGDKVGKRNGEKGENLKDLLK